MKRNLILAGAIALVIIVLLVIGNRPAAPIAEGKYAEFATCIAKSGATYYGAFWCPNCKHQEELFGDAKSLLPRIECSTPDGRSQLAVCSQANVTAYPTWEFADGSRAQGVQSLETLARRTGCVLPVEN